jgi:hypothetical protein
MKQLILILLLTIACKSSAQKKIPYEKLDSISSLISKYQSKSENLSYNDGKDTYKLSFLKDNFKIYYSTGKATKSVYKTKGEDEFLYLSENIDITKADDIYNTLYPGLAGAYRLTFPEGIKTQIYKNGEYVETISQDYLEFFYPRDIVYKYSNGSYHNAGGLELGSLCTALVFFKLENNDSKNLQVFLMHGSINTDKYGKHIKINQEKFMKETFGEIQAKLGIPSPFGWTSKMIWERKVSYLEEAFKNPLIRRHNESIVFELLMNLSYCENYYRMEEILNSPSAFFLPINERLFFNYRAQYMRETGKCTEVEKLLLSTFNSAESSKELKEKAKSHLELLYSLGCKGSKSNKVKKDKILAAQYQ